MISGHGPEAGVRGFRTPHRDLQGMNTRDLIRELLDEGRSLFREEVRLARAEVKDDIANTKRGATMFGAAGAVGYAALLSLTAALILLLALVMPAWLAAAIVAVAFGVVAGVLFAAGRSSLQNVSALGETRQTVKEDKEWASETMRAARSRNPATA